MKTNKQIAVLLLQNIQDEDRTDVTFKMTINYGLCHIAEELQYNGILTRDEVNKFKRHIHKVNKNKGYFWSDNATKSPNINEYHWRPNDKTSRVKFLNKVISN